MGRRPNNGPSLSKASERPRSAVNTTMAPSPARKQAALDQKARDAATERKSHQLIRRDPRTWLVALGIIKR